MKKPNQLIYESNLYSYRIQSDNRKYMGCIQTPSHVFNSHHFQQSIILQATPQNVSSDVLTKSQTPGTLRQSTKLHELITRKQIKKQQKKQAAFTNRYYRHGVQDELIFQLLMQKDDQQIIFQALRKNCFFKLLFQLQPADIQNIFNKLFQNIKKCQYDYRQYIYRQGDEAKDFYVIKQGRVAVQMNCETKKSLGTGQAFGQQAIIYQSQRFKSIKVSTQKCILFVIGKAQVLQISKKLNYKYRSQIQKKFDQKVHFYHFLTNKQKQQFVKNANKLKFTPNQIIFEQNYEANSFYIINSGKIVIKIKNKKDIVLQDGESFGQSAFLQKKGIRMGKAISLEQTTVFSIGSSFIIKILGSKLNCVIQYNLIKWSLYRNQLLSKLNEMHKIPYELLIQQFHIVQGKKFDLLHKKGQIAKKIYINLKATINFKTELKLFGIEHLYCICNQKIKREKHQEQRQSKKLKFTSHRIASIKDIGQIDEEISINQEPVNNQNIVLTQDGQFCYARIDKLVAILLQWKSIKSQNFIKNIANQSTNLQISIENIGQYIQLAYTQRKTVRLAIQQNYGVQFIVNVYKNLNSQQTKPFQQLPSDQLKGYEHRNSFNKAQMPSLKIDQIAKLISKLKHPNIAGFYKFEIDKTNSYILMEYIKAVTLQDVVNQLGLVPQVLIKYYMASLFILVDYLHSQLVIYRNFKPEQILVDNLGTIFLYNFDYSKQLQHQPQKRRQKVRQRHCRTTTIIGSPHYMAPQIIKNQPYSFNTDYWSLGVIAYELIYGKLPFGNDTDDPVEIFECVLTKQVKLKKQNSRQFLSKILQKDSKIRLSKIKDVINCQYMENFQWQKMKKCEYTAPYAPKHTCMQFKNNFIFN